MTTAAKISASSGTYVYKAIGPRMPAVAEAAACLGFGLVAGEEGALGARQLPHGDALGGERPHHAHGRLQGLLDLLRRAGDHHNVPRLLQALEQGDVEVHVVGETQ